MLVWISLSKRPEQHLDLSGQQEPVLFLGVSTPKVPDLYLEVSWQQEPVLHLDVYRLQEPVLHMYHVSRLHAGAFAPPWLVYTTEASAAPGRVYYNTGAEAVYWTYLDNKNPVLHLDISFYRSLCYISAYLDYISAYLHKKCWKWLYKYSAFKFMFFIDLLNLALWNFKTQALCYI